MDDEELDEAVMLAIVEIYTRVTTRGAYTEEVFRALRPTFPRRVTRKALSSSLDRLRAKGYIREGHAWRASLRSSRGGES